MNDTTPKPTPSLIRSIARGAGGFSAIAVAAFAVWAFGGGWFRGRGGEPAMYAVIAGVFLIGSGLLLHPLVHGPRSFIRFYQVFMPAFLLYAVVWSGFWFWLKFGLGEWLGAAAGSLVFVAYTAWRLGNRRSFWAVAAVFFALHTAGYFAGGWCMGKFIAMSRLEPVPMFDKQQLVIFAKLSWGVFYGLGFGAALGFAFHTLQRPDTNARSGAPSVSA